MAQKKPHTRYKPTTERKKRLCITLSWEIVDAIKQRARLFKGSKSAVINDLLKTAFTNDKRYIEAELRHASQQLSYWKYMAELHNNEAEIKAVIGGVK